MFRQFAAVLCLICFLTALEASLTPSKALAYPTLASCYGSELAGNLTASGDVFDPNALTTAHKTLPFGTVVVFSHAGNSVEAVVNDRGPWVGDREYDMSCGAMEALDLLPGVYEVEATVIG